MNARCFQFLINLRPKEEMQNFVLEMSRNKYSGSIYDWTVKLWLCLKNRHEYWGFHPKMRLHNFLFGLELLTLVITMQSFPVA